MRSEPDNPKLSRAEYALRGAGARDPNANPHRTGIHSRGYLPHVKLEGAEYFITFRLADSLPREVLVKYEAEKAARLRELERRRQRGEPGADIESDIHRDFRRRIERYLDRGAGACHLRNPKLAEATAGALGFFHGQRYVLADWVIMPNHVHVVMQPLLGNILGNIVKSWKQFSSRKAKLILGLPPGRFWQPESYDHWIRSDEERSRICEYIRRNPVTAGLCDRPEAWPWSSASQPSPP